MKVVSNPLALVEALIGKSEGSLIVGNDEQFKSHVSLQHAIKTCGLERLPILPNQANPKYLPYPYIADVCADFLYGHVVFDCVFAIDVLAVKSTGFGDLLFGLRTVQALRRYFPKAAVRLISNPEGAKQIRELDGHRGFRVEVFDAITYREKVRKKKLVPSKLIVMGPVIDGMAMAMLGHMRKVAPKAILIKIDEYGVSRSRPTARQDPSRCHSGLCMQELGFFTDPRLSADHQTGVLHNVDTVSEPLKEVLVQNIGEGNRLYLGYVHKAKSLTDYLHTVLLLESDKVETHGNDIDIVIGRSAWLTKPLEVVEDKVLKELYTASFTDVVIIDMGKDKDSRVDLSIKESATSLDEKPRRRLRFIFSPIRHADMMVLYTACQPLVCVTGDQSLTEALCSGKVLIYEVCDHKKDLFESLRLAWKVVIGNDVLEKLTNSDSRARLKLLSKGSVVLEQFAKFTSFLAKDRDLGLSLGRRAVRALMRALHKPLVALDERYVFSLLNLEKEDPEALGLLLAEIDKSMQSVQKSLADERSS